MEKRRPSGSARSASRPLPVETARRRRAGEPQLFKHRSPGSKKDSLKDPCPKVVLVAVQGNALMIVDTTVQKNRTQKLTNTIGIPLRILGPGAA